MDSKFSFLDQDDLFNDAAPPAAGGGGLTSKQQQQGGGGAFYGSPAAAAPPPLVPPSSPQANGFADALDSIARALAYTEKRVASAEARLLAALQDENKSKRNTTNATSWSTMTIFGGLVLLFLALGLVAAACMKRGGGPQQVVPPPMFVRAVPGGGGGAGPTPIVFSQGPPATFLS